MLRVADIGPAALRALLDRYRLSLHVHAAGEAIRGSFWGDSEAGIVGRTVYVRPDTPLHSFLHETCHVICMSADRRAELDRDAGGDAIEESAVCYLQLVLAEHIEKVGRERIAFDMDAWGYSFRLGSTMKWFRNDAEDAVQFLSAHGILSGDGQPTFALRE